MGQSVGVVGCCAVREKQTGHLDISMRDNYVHKPMQFQLVEKTLHLERPAFASFSPMHQREASLARRIALASQEEMHIYLLSSGDSGGSDLGHEPVLTHRLSVSPGQAITGLIFPDSDNSRSVVVAHGACSGDPAPNQYFVRVWRCEEVSTNFLGARPGAQAAAAVPSSSSTATLTEWSADDAGAAALSLEDHGCAVSHLATNKGYLVTVDDKGVARLFHKSRSFAKSAQKLLHQDGVADIGVDRLYVYSAGRTDRRVCVFNLPDLTIVLWIPMVLPADLRDRLAHSSPPGWATSQSIQATSSQGPTFRAVANGNSAPTATNGTTSSRTMPGLGEPVEALDIFERITAIQRPTSRWSGWQGSMRGPRVPRGCLFVAAVLRDREAVFEGAGVLMEWSLGETPSCRTCQIAHSSAIVALVYGPYDNGPVVSADATGCFRVWELLLGEGLRCTQQVTAPYTGSFWGNASPGPAMAVEQPYALYMATGERRLNVWVRTRL